MLIVDRCRRRDEQGSLIVAVGVLMILTFLSLAVLARSTSTLVNVKRTQNFSGALAVADGGLSDALYQIDQAPSATFTRSGTVGSGTYSYTATRVDTNTWNVLSKGTLAGVRHAIKATVSRQIVYPYAIYTQQSLTLDGANVGNIYSFPTPGDAAIGSNNTVVCRGPGGGDKQDYYQSYSGCPNAVHLLQPRPLPDPPMPTGATQACPVGGVFTGMVSGAGGPFVCNTNVTFSGTVTVSNPPVTVWVGPNYGVSMADAAINNGGGTYAKDFLLLKAGTGPFDVGNGTHAGTMTGVLYAPSTDITVNGGQCFLTGSLTANAFTVNGGPNFTMAYDDSVRTIVTSDWKVSSWREVPSTTTS